MHDNSEIKEVKRIDPIWKRLRFERIWKLLFLAFMVIYVASSASRFWQTEGAPSIFVLFFLLFGVVAGTINQFKWESYWKRIGQRRLEALQDPQPFVADSQPWAEANALPLPASIRLRWNPVMLGVVVALVLIAFGLILLGIVLGSFHRNTIHDALLISGFLSFLIVVIALLTYFLFMRYQPQEIELTEQGVRTRYMGQERSLRWDEARIFAVYDAQGVRKSVFAQTYELSNEQTVVRWGQQRLANPFLVVQSSMNKGADFNWLFGQISALVKARTGLPLLDLSDRPKVRQSALQPDTQSMPVHERSEGVSPMLPVRIAENDPLLRRLQLRGEFAMSFGLILALSIIAIVTGLIAKLSNNAGNLSSMFSDAFTTYLLIIGVLLLLLALIVLGIILISRSYWKRIGRLRPEALRQPERFKVRTQPAPYLELPQLASLRIHTRRTVMIPLILIENFVLWFIFYGILFGLVGSRLYIALIMSLLAGLVMSVLLTPVVEKAQERRIEVTPDGITGRFGGVDSQMRWQDARLFSVYRGPQLFKAVSRRQVYELASEQTVVRWLWSGSHFQMFTTEPRMGREAVDVWMERLNGYIEAQTSLPLIELDTAERQ